MLARRAPKQQYAQARLATEIERPFGFCPQTIVQRPFEIRHSEVDFAFRCNHLNQLARALLQRGTEHLVAFYDFVETGTKNRHVQVARQAEYERNVIKGIRRIQPL